jgi:uncharacterized protein involved in outer membrane biogenesis
VKYRLPPRIVLTGVQFDNPSWARGERMLEAEQISFTVRLLPLFRGQVVLPDVWLVAPMLALEVSNESVPNWMLHAEKPPEKPEEQKSLAPVVERLTIDRGKLTYFDPNEKTDLAFDVSSEAAQGPEGLRAHGGGKYKGYDTTAKGSGGEVLSLLDAESPYPFHLDLKSGSTTVSLHGTVTGLAAFSGADLQLHVHGATMSDAYTLADLALPQTPPYDIKGRLIKEGDTWKLHGFTGQVGDSDLGGNLDVTYRNGRPDLVADLHSRVVDLDDLAGFIGAAPSAEAGETSSAQQKVTAVKEAADPRLLPNDPIQLEKLRSLDADVKYVGESIRNTRSPIDKLEAHLVLKDGNLTLSPLNFTVAGGRISSEINIDARQDPLKVGAKTEVRNLQLSKLFPQNELLKTSVGVIGGRANLQGTGNSVAALAAHADGSLGLATKGGKVSNLLMEAVGLDAFEIAKFLFRGDQSVALNCAVADFAIRDGIVKPHAFVLDTSDTNVHVEGNVNLRDESLDLSVHALPKNYSPLALRSPLHVKGTLKDPKVRPDTQLAVKVSVAAVLGALVNPLLALLPLIEMAPGEDANCAQLIAAVQQHSSGSFAAAPMEPPPAADQARPQPQAKATLPTLEQSLEDKGLRPYKKEE